MNYQQRKALGLCCVCGKTESERDTTRCTACRERNNKRKRDQRARWEAQGICRLCGKVPAEGKTTRCATCKSKRRAVARARPANLLDAKYLSEHLVTYNARHWSDRINGDARTMGADAVLASMTGISVRQIKRLRRGDQQLVKLDTADRLCLALGLHLSEVYRTSLGSGEAT